MGFNLADAFAGAAQGFGSGMAQIGKMGMEQEAQRTTDEAKADLMLKREKAMAQFNNDLQAPDKQRDYDLRSKVADAQIADHSLRNEMTGKMNDARAAYLTEKAANDALRAEAAKTKAEGAGGAGNGKRELTMNDVEKEQLKNFQERIRDAEKDAAMNPAAASKALAIKQEMMDTFGGKEVRIGKDGRTEFRDRFGNTQAFKSAEEARKAGWGSEELDQREKMVNEYKAKHSPQKPAETTAKPQADAGKIGGLPSPSRFNLADVLSQKASEDDQRAEKMAIAYRYKGLPSDKLQQIIKTAQDPDQKAAAQWALSDAMSRGSNMDFAYGGM